MRYSLQSQNTSGTVKGAEFYRYFNVEKNMKETFYRDNDIALSFCWKSI